MNKKIQNMSYNELITLRRHVNNELDRRYIERMNKTNKTKQINSDSK